MESNFNEKILKNSKSGWLEGKDNDIYFTTIDQSLKNDSMSKGSQSIIS